MTRLFLFALLAFTATAQTEAPKYILAGGVSYDAVAHQSSGLTTLAVKVTEIAGLPTYQQTTIETALAKTPTDVNNSATIRAGVAQAVYQTPGRGVTLGICGDAGVMKAGDTATLGTLTGCGWLAWDIGAKVTKGKSHVYLIPTYRLIAINGVQTKPSWSLRIGTGF
jgi:hypothetical protein